MVMATNPQSAPSAAPASAQRTAAPSTADAGVAGNNAVVSPESVGREFVRQYYTLLNRGPEHLHRFYLNNSSFVHGGVDPDGNPEEPVYGQMDINEKILSLNFRDCHAKIRQVDSHATLGDGVVVQVTGELSNNGEPMRRFMQTFVLAPQSAKKYYVRNDIFRYQDEVFNDTDSEPENDGCGSVSEGEEASAEPPLTADITVQDTPYYEPHPAVVSNGTAHLESPETTPTKAPEMSEVGMEITQEATPVIPEEVVQPPAPVMENHEVEPDEEQPEPEEPADKGPKVPSWADRARSAPTSASAVPSTNYPPMQTQPVPVPKPVEPVAAVNTAGGQPPRPGVSAVDPLPQREPRKDRDREPMRGRPIGGRRPMEGGPDQTNRLRPSQIPDSHQLFVGNLPQDVNDDELREFFSTYGNVVEMRINRNTGPKPLPYFGFIVFSDPNPVQKILAQKRKGPIFLRGEHRLNVEEKKARGTEVRPRSTRPGSGGPPRGGASGRGGPRGGMGGGINKGGGPGRGYNPQR